MAVEIEDCMQDWVVVCLMAEWMIVPLKKGISLLRCTERCVRCQVEPYGCIRIQILRVLCK